MSTNQKDFEHIKTLKAISIIIIGFLIGILSGLLGVGGGVFLIPAMVFLLGMTQHRAHGTSLAVIGGIVLFSAIFYSRHGQVDWLVAFLLAFGGIIGASFGAKLCNMLSPRRLRKYFGILLVLVGIRMMIEAFAFVQNGMISAEPAISANQLGGGIIVFLVGILTGVLSGLFGIGGGLVMIPMLVLLFGYPQVLAQGISLAVIIPVSISGAYMHNKLGNVRWDVVVWLIIGGIFGGLLGARIAVLEVQEATLRIMFGILMLIMGLLMARNRRTEKACETESKSNES